MSNIGVKALDDLSLWLIFLLIGLATTLPRASFIVLGNRVSLPTNLQRALRYAPAAALAAIVVPDLLVVQDQINPLNAKLGGGIAAVITALSTRNPWAPFIAGMAVLLLLQGI